MTDLTTILTDVQTLTSALANAKTQLDAIQALVQQLQSGGLNPSQQALVDQIGTAVTSALGIEAQIEAEEVQILTP